MKIIVTAIALLLASSVNAEQLTHKFHNPSFEGNAGAHWLSIEEKLLNKKEKLKAEKEAEAEKAQHEAENTNLAKFLKNVEARVYSELSKQLVDNMFGENSSNSGSVTLEGNTISYVKDGDYVTLTVVDATGHSTVVKVPIGNFTF